MAMFFKSNFSVSASHKLYRIVYRLRNNDLGQIFPCNFDNRNVFIGRFSAFCFSNKI